MRGVNGELASRPNLPRIVGTSKEIPQIETAGSYGSLDPPPVHTRANNSIISSSCVVEILTPLTTLKREKRTVIKSVRLFDINSAVFGNSPLTPLFDRTGCDQAPARRSRDGNEFKSTLSRERQSLEANTHGD